MRISCINNYNLNGSQVTFAKQLRAKCTLRKENDKSIPCQIYELNINEDADYFIKLTDRKYWKDGSYIWEMDDEFKSEVTGQHSYVMETFFGKCLGYIIVETDEDDKNNSHRVSFLETCPEYKYKEDRTSMKYIGETLLAFATSIAKKEGVSSVQVPAWEPKAEKFYKKNCGFKEKEDILTLNSCSFNKFISKNKTHSNLQIDTNI